MLGNTILTPVTLWKDFEDSLPLEEKFFDETKTSAGSVRAVRFLGRQTECGRVDIYAEYYTPKEKQFPVVMLLFEAGLPFDRDFIARIADKGYGVLCVDYSGDMGRGAPCTVYPEDVDYANYLRSGSHLLSAEPTARETSWYEWAAVARYAAKFLMGREEVTSFGVMGLRTGGEILFKVAPYIPAACLISVCAAGWLAYQDIDRFGGAETRAFDAERHRFIAGVDSQSYAPFLKCPVLLLSAINDRKYNYDRVYDTFRQIPAAEKAILFSAHGNGLIGSHSMYDIDLFLQKYLKRQTVFIPKPIEVAVSEDEGGNLVAQVTFDGGQEIKEFGVFYTEKVMGSGARDWVRVLGNGKDLSGNKGTVPISLYKGCRRALVYAFVNYANNFSVTSNILDFTVSKEYTNTRPKTRVIYTNADGRNVFTSFGLRSESVADCFHSDRTAGVHLARGYGGILGVTSDVGMISYRVGEDGYEPPAGAAFRFDAWCAERGSVKVTFFKSEETQKGYSCEVRVEGGGKWKDILLDAMDFKQEGGAPLTDFAGVVSVLFECKGEVLINNVLWI